MFSFFFQGFQVCDFPNPVVRLLQWRHFLLQSRLGRHFRTLNHTSNAPFLNFESPPQKKKHQIYSEHQKKSQFCHHDDIGQMNQIESIFFPLPAAVFPDFLGSGSEESHGESQGNRLRCFGGRSEWPEDDGH